jgi:hypothetical protein
MSSELVRQTIPTPLHLATKREETVAYRWQVYAAFSVLAVAANYVFGKEMAWDLLHYHFYSGFSALNDRFAQDYFAAGPNSYLNPYAYVPFYALVRLGLPALAVGTVMAAIQSVVLWLTFEIACRVSPLENRKARFFFALCATILAFMNPVLLQQIGSSFSDITTSALVLGGWLLLVSAIQRPRMRLVIFGAILLGIATSLKLTNGLYAVAAFILVAFVPAALIERVRNLFYFGAALGVSFAVAAASWSLQLTRMFGNPLFPFMNTVFKSPEIVITSAKPYRFVPDSLVDALMRPFAMIGTDGMIAEELAAPDLRYALLLILFLISAIAWIRRWRTRGSPSPIASQGTSATRALMALGCGFTFAWVVWLALSGNSRYFLSMECIAGILAVALLFQMLATRAIGRTAILLALFIGQGTALAFGTEFRWNQAPWDGGPWFDVEIPQSLSSQPNLYLSIGMQSNSYIAPFLAKGSGVINFAGGYPLGPDGANAARVRAMIARNRPHLRVLVAGERIYENSALRLPRRSDVDDALRTFALRVDMSNCETITIRGMRPIVWRPVESPLAAPSIPSSGKPRYTSYLATCQLVSDTKDETKEMAARRAVDVVLDRLEDACPALFQPRRPQSEHIGQVWQRFYGATDLTAWVSNGEVKFASAVRNLRTVVVGSEDAWTKRPQALECGRRNGVYFARLTQPGL